MTDAIPVFEWSSLTHQADPDGSELWSGSGYHVGSGPDHSFLVDGMPQLPTRPFSREYQDRLRLLTPDIPWVPTDRDVALKLRTQDTGGNAREIHSALNRSLIHGTFLDQHRALNLIRSKAVRELAVRKFSAYSGNEKHRFQMQDDGPYQNETVIHLGEPAFRFASVENGVTAISDFAHLDMSEYDAGAARGCELSALMLLLQGRALLQSAHNLYHVDGYDPAEMDSSWANQPRGVGFGLKLASALSELQLTDEAIEAFLGGVSPRDWLNDAADFLIEEWSGILERNSGRNLGSFASYSDLPQTMDLQGHLDKYHNGSSRNAPTYLKLFHDGLAFDGLGRAADWNSRFSVLRRGLWKTYTRLGTTQDGRLSQFLGTTRYESKEDAVFALGQIEKWRSENLREDQEQFQVRSHADFWYVRSKPRWADSMVVAGGLAVGNLLGDEYLGSGFLKGHVENIHNHEPERPQYDDPATVFVRRAG